MSKIKPILSFAVTVCSCFSFQHIIYGADEDMSKHVNARFFHISHLIQEEHKRLGLPTKPEKDIEVLCEERTFGRIRREQKMEDALEKLKAISYKPEVYEFAVEAVTSVFQNKEMTRLASNHVRSYFEIAGIPFTSIYLEEYEKLNSQHPSYITALDKYPESKKVFEVLARDMKEHPHLLDSFLKDYGDSPYVKALRAEIVEYVKTL